MKTRLALSALIASTATAIFAGDETVFVPLFNGKDTTGWHLRREDGHNSWVVALKNTVSGHWR